jgi:hypothetical protein
MVKSSTLAKSSRSLAPGGDAGCTVPEPARGHHQILARGPERHVSGRPFGRRRARTTLRDNETQSPLDFSLVIGRTWHRRIDRPLCVFFSERTRRNPSYDQALPTGRARMGSRKDSVTCKIAESSVRFSYFPKQINTRMKKILDDRRDAFCGDTDLENTSVSRRSICRPGHAGWPGRRAPQIPGTWLCDGAHVQSFGFCVRLLASRPLRLFIHGGFALACVGDAT